jgi:hypothetical protein
MRRAHEEFLLLGILVVIDIATPARLSVVDLAGGRLAEPLPRHLLTAA